MTSDQNRIPLSGVMVIHNEERLLDRSLRSFADLADDLVIIHDGPCSDRSLEIARRYTDRVYVRDWQGAASPHRPESFRLARHDWILEIDADEYLSEEMRQAIPKLIRQGDGPYDFVCPSLSGGKNHFGYYTTRLFRKSQMYFIGLTHEYVKPIDRSTVPVRVDATLWHDSKYDNFSWEVFRKKWLAKAEGHARQFAADFASVPKWNYSKPGWDSPNDRRIRHPLLLGVCGTFVYHMAIGLRNAIRYRSAFYLRHELFYSLYYAKVFWSLFWLQQSRPSG